MTTTEKKNIDSKMRKYPAMYNQTIRKMVFKLGVGAMEATHRFDYQRGKRYANI